MNVEIGTRKENIVALALLDTAASVFLMGPGLIRSLRQHDAVHDISHASHEYHHVRGVCAELRVRVTGTAVVMLFLTPVHPILSKVVVLERLTLSFSLI